MARRDVVEITCDRCGRTETQSSTETPKHQGPELEANFHGVKTTFNDLCKRCRDAVRGYFTRLSKKVDEKEEKPSNVVAVDPVHPPKQEPPKKGILGLGGR